MIITIFRSSIGADERHIFLYMERKHIKYVNFNDIIFFVSKDASNFKRALYFFTRPIFRLVFNVKILYACVFFEATQLIIFKGILIHPYLISYLSRRLRISIIYPDLDPSVYGKSYLKMLTRTHRLYYTKPNLIDYYKKLFGDKANLITPLIDWESAESIGDYNPLIGVLFVGHYSLGKYQSINNFARRFSGRVTIIGSGWKSMDFPSSVNCVGEIYDTSLFKYYQSALCALGFLQENISNDGKGDVITARSYNIPYFGGIILHASNLYIRDVYKNNQNYLFDSLDDLLQKIYYLQNNLNQRNMIHKDQVNILKMSSTKISKIFDNE